MSKKKPTVLMILDGYGLNDKVEGNAVKQANTPVMDDLMANCPFVEGQASGMAVGLPEGQMGNSEVGHLNMGAGRKELQGEWFRTSSDGSCIRWWCSQPHQPHLWSA